MPRSTRTPASAPWLLASLLLAIPAELVGQSRATVVVEENFRRAPNEVVVARLNPGTSLSVVDREGDWLEVDVEGWVWLNSLQMSDDELDLVVSVSEGENLRAEPQGAVLGRLEEGTLLEELGREPGWAQVRRRGWIWSASVSEGAAAAATTAAGSTPAASATPPPGAAPPARRPEGFTSLRGAPILTAPDGDTLAVASARGDLQIVSREGSWARVRLDGWVWMPEEAGTPGDDTPAALVPADLASDPDAHTGRVVSWTLQFISLESAEELRTDFRRGEPFLLSRYGGPEGTFVYVAVPPELESRAEGLAPLEMIEVTARVRTGASALTGTPIVDLLSLERGR